MTRFQKHDESVVYEIAQVKLIVENKSSGSSGGDVTKDVVVRPVDEVLHPASDRNAANE